MDPMEVEVLDHLPDSVTFYEEYVKTSRPVVFRGAAKRMETYEEFRSDAALKFVFNIFFLIDVNILAFLVVFEYHFVLK